MVTEILTLILSVLVFNDVGVCLVCSEEDDYRCFTACGGAMCCCVCRGAMWADDHCFKVTDSDGCQYICARTWCCCKRRVKQSVYAIHHCLCHPGAPRSFVEENAGVYDRQVYGVLETVAVLDPSVVQALIPNLSLSLRNTEHKRGLGKNIALRWESTWITASVPGAT